MARGRGSGKRQLSIGVSGDKSAFSATMRALPGEARQAAAQVSAGLSQGSRAAGNPLAHIMRDMASLQGRAIAVRQDLARLAPGDRAAHQYTRELTEINGKLRQMQEQARDLGYNLKAMPWANPELARATRQVELYTKAIQHAQQAGTRLQASEARYNKAFDRVTTTEGRVTRAAATGDPARIAAANASNAKAVANLKAAESDIAEARASDINAAANIKQAQAHLVAAKAAQASAAQQGVAIGQQMQAYAMAWDAGLGAVEQRYGRFLAASSRAGSMMIGAAAAAAAAIGMLAVAAGQYADKLLDLEDITGLSTTALQEFEQVSRVAGVEFTGITSAVQQLNRRLIEVEEDSGRAADTLARLGVDAYDANGALLSMDEIFPAVLAKLQAMPNVTERNMLAMQLFGRSLDSIGPILGMTAEAMEDARRSAHTLGFVMSGEAISAANELRIEFENTKKAFSMAGMEIANNLLPVIKQLVPIAQRVAEMLRGVNPQWVANGIAIAAVSGVVLKLLPVLVRTVAGVRALAAAFAAMRPAVVATELTAASGAIAATGTAAMGTTVAVGGMRAAMVAATASARGLMLALAMNPITWIAAAVVAIGVIGSAVGRAVAGVDAATSQSIASARASMEVAEAAGKRAEAAVTSYRDGLDGMVERYDMLSRAQSRTVTEEGELAQLKTVLAERIRRVRDELGLQAQAWDGTTAAILRNGTEVEKAAIRQQRDTRRIKLQSAVTDATARADQEFARQSRVLWILNPDKSTIQAGRAEAVELELKNRALTSDGSKAQPFTTADSNRLSELVSRKNLLGQQEEAPELRRAVDEIADAWEAQFAEIAKLKAENAAAKVPPVAAKPAGPDPKLVEEYQREAVVMAARRGQANEARRQYPDVNTPEGRAARREGTRLAVEDYALRARYGEQGVPDTGRVAMGVGGRESQVLVSKNVPWERGKTDAPSMVGAVDFWQAMKTLGFGEGLPAKADEETVKRFEAAVTTATQVALIAVDRYFAEGKTPLQGGKAILSEADIAAATQAADVTRSSETALITALNKAGYTSGVTGLTQSLTVPIATAGGGTQSSGTGVRNPPPPELDATGKLLRRIASMEPGQAAEYLQQQDFAYRYQEKALTPAEQKSADALVAQGKRPHEVLDQSYKAVAKDNPALFQTLAKDAGLQEALAVYVLQLDYIKRVGAAERVVNGERIMATAEMRKNEDEAHKRSLAQKVAEFAAYRETEAAKAREAEKAAEDKKRATEAAAERTKRLAVQQRADDLAAMRQSEDLTSSRAARRLANDAVVARAGATTDEQRAQLNLAEEGVVTQQRIATAKRDTVRRLEDEAIRRQEDDPAAGGWVAAHDRYKQELVTGTEQGIQQAATALSAAFSRLADTKWGQVLVSAGKDAVERLQAELNLRVLDASVKLKADNWEQFKKSLLAEVDSILFSTEYQRGYKAALENVRGGAEATRQPTLPAVGGFAQAASFVAAPTSTLPAGVVEIAPGIYGRAMVPGTPGGAKAGQTGISSVPQGVSPAPPPGGGMTAAVAGAPGLPGQPGAAVAGAPGLPGVAVAGAPGQPGMAVAGLGPVIDGVAAVEIPMPLGEPPPPPEGFELPTPPPPPVIGTAAITDELRRSIAIPREIPPRVMAKGKDEFVSVVGGMAEVQAPLDPQMGNFWSKIKAGDAMKAADRERFNAWAPYQAMAPNDANYQAMWLSPPDPNGVPAPPTGFDGVGLPPFDGISLPDNIPVSASDAAMRTAPQAARVDVALSLNTPLLNAIIERVAGAVVHSIAVNKRDERAGARG